MFLGGILFQRIKIIAMYSRFVVAFEDIFSLASNNSLSVFVRGRFDVFVLQENTGNRLDQNDTGAPRSETVTNKPPKHSMLLIQLPLSRTTIQDCFEPDISD